MAFFNHFNPKSSKRMPMTRRSASIGTHWTSAVPSVATSRASVAAAANAPSSELRQLTVTPTTRTMVNASTNSTAEAKNEAVATTHCIEKLLVKTYHDPKQSFGTEALRGKERRKKETKDDLMS